MADGSKPIKNTLLSAATGANFFEDAAMFVPVPLVEPVSQEPATAEIDLNSDDSSSNRGSIEKELTEQLVISETVNDSPFEEKETAPPPISLFSRAATGVDAFSRMLAGSSAPKPESVVPKEQQEVQSEPSVVTMSAASEVISPPSAEGSVPCLLRSPEPQSRSSPIALIPPVSPPGAHVSSTNDAQVASASTLFSSTPASSLFQTSIAQPPSHFQTAAPPPFSAPIPTAPVRPLTGFPSFPVSSAGGDPTTVVLPSPASSTLSTILLPSAPPTAAHSLISTSITTNGPPVVASSMPNLTTPGVPNVASVPPPTTGAANSNAFRLGAQRMKYVPCPEMQSVPVSTLPTAQAPPPPNFQPPTPHNSFASPVTSPSALAPLKSNFKVAEHGYGLPNNNQSYPGTPPNSMDQMHQQSLSPTRTSVPPMGVGNANAYLQSTVGGMQTYGPQELTPLTFHWFYRKDADGKTSWKPFSIIDSVALEDSLLNDPSRLVPTDGGRYDVCVQKRVKTSVYWDETPVEVRRGCWFYKGPMDNRFVPYDEDFSLRLENEYADCMRTGIWQKRLEFPDGESVIMHNAGVVVHFCQAAAPDDWGNLPESQIRPRVVKRGVEDIEMEDGESTQIDHLVFVVHGIGPICDFKLRNIVEAVDDFRGLSFQLLHNHFRDSIEKNLVGRVEFLPVQWHKSLHGDKGIDEQLKRITLRSIPKFRDFTNDTLLDILFYTSPVYCQTIVESVSSELNRIYKLFLSRNPTFQGKVSLTGHSLGSLILFDLLAHQPSSGTQDAITGDETATKATETPLNADAPKTDQSEGGSSSRTVSYTVGTAGTGQPFISYPTIDFAPTAFFALGSPIAMFVTVRGIEKLGNDFRFPTCPAFFNIFHPYDPVAYRMETLIDPTFIHRPILIPHHKGRKRIHLELKETMARVGADIKHRVIDAVKSTINTVYHYTGFTKTQENLENEIQTAVHQEMERKAEADGAEDENSHIRIGSLNGGRRIDHVLQEAPYETFNEYVFAMSTHVGYWESEDTMLLILTEIYGGMGVQKDRNVPSSQGLASPTHLPSPQSTASFVSQLPYHPLNIASPTYPGGSMPHLPSAPPYSESQGIQIPAGGFSSPSLSTSMTSVPHEVLMLTSSTASVLMPPNPAFGLASSATTVRPSVIGNRPVVDPTLFPRGMDPTAPMLTMPNVGPPPKAGFLRK